MWRWVYRLWEVGGNPPSTNMVDAVVSMSLSPTKDGACGPTLKPVVELAAFFIKIGRAHRLILSNRYVVAGKNLALEMKAEAIGHGVPAEKIILPKDPWSPEIRNTFMEAKFAIDTVLGQKIEDRRPRLLIIANHIHMRRVLAAFHIISAGRIDLYWIGVRDPHAYTTDVHQTRFRHLSWFLAYEIIALIYSKLKGWA